MRFLTKIIVLCALSLPGITQANTPVDYAAHVEGDTLNLPRLGLTDSDMPNVITFLKQRPEIKKLYLTQNEIRVSGAKALAEVSTITSLELSYNYLISDEGAIALSNNKNFKYLGLANDNIGVAGAKALTKAQNLIELNLARNNIGDEGAAAFESNSSITTLNLSNNGISDVGVIALARNKKITNLNLSTNHLKNHAITDVGALALAETQTIISLNLDNNCIGEVGHEALVNNKTIKNLSFMNNGVCAWE